MDDTLERIKKIDIENKIWIIYFGIIFLSYIANYYEKDFFLNKNILSKNIYRKLNILVFIILIIIYLYFEQDSITSFMNTTKDDKKYKYDKLNLIATTLVLISGIIFLYILIDDDNLLEEIAFN